MKAPDEHAQFLAQGVRTLGLSWLLEAFSHPPRNLHPSARTKSTHLEDHPK